MILITQSTGIMLGANASLISFTSVYSGQSESPSGKQKLKPICAAQSAHHSGPLFDDCINLKVLHCRYCSYAAYFSGGGIICYNMLILNLFLLMMCRQAGGGGEW